MGWALTYSIRLKRPLTTDEQAALDRWSREHDLRLSPTRGDAFDAWRGLLPDARIDELKQSDRKSAPPGADYASFFQVRTEAHFRKLVRAFQKLEALLPGAEILLSDDYHLSNERPSEVELSGTPSARPRKAAEPAPPPMLELEGEEEPDPDSDDVAAALERAKREFERWKKSKS
jgi:hypothetical protein